MFLTKKEFLNGRITFSKVDKRICDIVRSKMKAQKLTPHDVARLWDCEPKKRGKIINRIEQLVKYDNFTESEDMKRNLFRILNLTEEDIKAIEECRTECKQDELERNKQTECFLDNYLLLQKYADLIISTKEYSNITIPRVFCGFMYAQTRTRPLTLGELLSYHQNNLFIYDCKDVEKAGECNSTSCCKKLYALSIVGSPLSGSTWIKAFCPVCQRVYQEHDGGAWTVIKYPQTAPFKYEKSSLNIIALVELLKGIDSGRIIL